MRSSMHPDALRTLIADGATLDVEFKGESRAALSDSALVENVVCLSNRYGTAPGYLLIGVEDDGRVTGARPRHEAGATDPLRVQTLIANQTQPSIACRVAEVRLDDRPVLVVEVPSSRMPVSTTDGKYLRRRLGGLGIPICAPFHFVEMQAALASQGSLDYSALPVPDARWEDLDPLEFARFRRALAESGGQGDPALLTLPDLELAQALGAVTAKHDITEIRVLALLLFGTEQALTRLLPQHESALQRISGDRVRVNDFLRWPLLRVMDEALGRFRAFYAEEEILVGMQRIGIPNCSPRVFREAVANALIHRDYAQLGTVHVQWKDDRLEVSNPGGFPEGVHLGNLLVTSARPRNFLLADAFKRAGLAERTARGIDLIFREQLRAGYRPPFYDHSTQAAVALCIPGGRSDAQFVRLIAECNVAGASLGLNELLALDHLKRMGELTLARAAALMQSPASDSAAVLDRLAELGLVVRPAEPTQTAYALAPEGRLRLGLETT